MAHTVFIRGIPGNPNVLDVRVRNVAGIDGITLFRALLNSTATADDVVLDPQSTNFQGQVYRWFHLTFTDKRDGWVRDDLLDLQGDLTALGYGNYARRTFAFVAAQSVPAEQIKKVVPPLPVQPAPPIMPPPNPNPSIAPVQTPICKGSARADVQPNVRTAPTITAAPLGRLQPNDPVEVYGVEPGRDGDGFRWVKIDFNGVFGYVREDLLNYRDECGVLGLPKPPIVNPDPRVMPIITINAAKFDVPVNGYIITQEFGVGGHKGTDFGLRVGAPVTACGSGTAFVMRCQRCRDDAPNFLSQGIRSEDRANFTRNINDPAWGYGFGNCVIVRYAWESLPDAMRALMTQRGLSNGFVYAIHGHLSRIDVSDGQPVNRGTVIGACGNTGNSSGPHLHLELRLSSDGLATRIDGLFNRVTENPRMMYNI